MRQIILLSKKQDGCKILQFLSVESCNKAVIYQFGIAVKTDFQQCHW